MNQENYRNERETMVAVGLTQKCESIVITQPMQVVTIKMTHPSSCRFVTLIINATGMIASLGLF